MKAMTKLSILICTMFLSISMFAQTKIGTHAGVNFSDMSSSSFAFDAFDGILPHPKRLIGTSYGVTSEFLIQDNFSFQTGLSFTDKGFMLKENFNLDIFDIPVPVGGQINARLKYLEVPLVAKYAFYNRSGITPYVKAGATVGYATSAKMEVKAKVIVPIKIAEIPVGLNSNLYNRFEVGAMIGGGLQFNAGPGTLSLDATYTHGLSSLINTPVVDLKARNNSFGIGIGYAVPLTKNQIRA